MCFSIFIVFKVCSQHAGSHGEILLEITHTTSDVALPVWCRCVRGSVPGLLKGSFCYPV